MSYLKLAFSSFRKNKLTFVLIVFETAALLLTVNFLVSTLADRKMLTKPYEKILNDNSAFVWDANYLNNKMRGVADNTNKSREILLSGITDKYEIYDSAAMFSNGADIVIAVSDELYDSLSLPLMSGNYSGAVANFGYTKNYFDFIYYVGQNRIAKTITIDVTGTLTADTYLPLMRSFSSGRDFTTKDLYINSDEYDSFIIVRQSEFSGLEIPAAGELGFIIHFPENYEENVAKLSEKAGVIDGKTILDNSQSALWNDLSDFLPAVICVLLVVIIGVVSVSVIMNKCGEKRGGVLWLCGYSRRQILTSHLIIMSIIFVISIALSAAAYLILSLMKIELAVSANLSVLNLITTLILSLILVAVSMIIPAVKSRKSSPVEYLRRAK